MPLINNDRLGRAVVCFGTRLAITAATLAILAAALLIFTLVFLR